MTGVEPLVSFGVKNLLTFLIEEAQFLDAVGGKVEDMKRELTRMQTFLIDADRRRSEGDTSVGNLVVEIRELAYDAEDVIVTFVVKVARARAASHHGRPVCLDLKGCFRLVKTTQTRHVVGTQIQEINNKIVALREGLQTYKVEPTATDRRRKLRRTYPTAATDIVVGLEDHVATVVKDLKDKSHSRVISICGMGGLGKTTFSKEIHRHREIKFYFDHVAWVCVSQPCNPTQVWRDVLLQFAQTDADKSRVRQQTSDELVAELESFQMQKKCLVILDDIWEQKDWNELNHAFPRATATGSKILITTRSKDVVAQDDIKCFLYELPLLKKEECLELLEKKLSRDGQEFQMEPEKKRVIENIVQHCGGLPLAIVLVGGLLAENNTLEGCEKVRRDLRNSLSKGNSRNEGVWDVLALSYQNLRYHLKACFLYFSLFPEDYEIVAKELVQMWIAEGFLSTAAGREGMDTMLEVGLSYLDELVNRCIVLQNISKYGKSSRFCRLHDLMRDFCRSKASEENFFVEYGGLGQSASCSSSSPNTIRRLAVNLKHVITIPHGQQYQHVRSCVVHLVQGDMDTLDGLDGINSLLKRFKFLKVFYSTYYRFDDDGVLSKDIGKLVHLRYLRVPDCKVLPSSLGNLILLQTLDLRGISCSVPDILWKLTELRYLYLPFFFGEGCTYKLRLDGLSKMEELHGLDTRSCEVGDLATLVNLRRLRIDHCKVTDLAEILESPVFSESNSLLQNCSVSITGDTETQEQHVHLCRVSPFTRFTELSLEGRMYDESFLRHLNANITHITLTGCRLKEDPMPALGKMLVLRVLYLLHDSYIGEKMECRAPQKAAKETTSCTQVSFPQLILLTLCSLEISEWKVDQGAIPCLSELRLYDCHKLKEIPDGLKFISTLEELRFNGAQESLKMRIVQGGEDFHKIQHVPVIIIEKEDWKNL